MAPTLDDLRLTLREMADEHPAPAPADLLAGLRDERAARRTRRRWGYAAGVAATAAAVAALAQGLSSPPETSPADPPGDGLERGWVLTDGQPPRHADGLELLGAQELAAGGEEQVSGPAPSPSGPQRWAVLWCDVGPALDDPAVQPPGLLLADADGAGTDVSIPCVPSSGDPGTVTPVALPPAVDGEQSWAATWEGDLPRGAGAVVAVYEEATRAGYPFPGFPDPPLTPPAPAAGSTVVDGQTPTTTAELAYLPGQTPPPDGTLMRQEVHAVTVTVGPESTLELWAGAPGVLRVAVDGTWATSDGDDPQAWAHQDPELRAGGWDVFAAGRSRTLELPEQVRPAQGQTREVQVAVQPVLAGAPWQVVVTGPPPDGTATGEPASALAPVQGPVSVPGTGGVEDELPDWYAGLHRAATWELPTDGSAARLELPTGLTERLGEVTWMATCPPEGPAPGLGEARITAGEQVITLRCDWLESDLVRLSSPAPGSEGDPGAPVEAALPSSAAGTTGTISAYLPVAFEEFDHEQAAPLLEVYSDTAMYPEGLVVEETVTRADLGPDGSATLTVTDRTQAVRFTSEGVGRVHVSVVGDGAAELLPNGFWTAWSDEPTSLLGLGSLSHALSPGDVLELRVEGYEDGDIRIESLRSARS